jgi:hypothetical protein
MRTPKGIWVCIKIQIYMQIAKIGRETNHAEKTVESCKLNPFHQMDPTDAIATDATATKFGSVGVPANTFNCVEFSFGTIKRLRFLGQILTFSTGKANDPYSRLYNPAKHVMQKRSEVNCRRDCPLKLTAEETSYKLGFN